MYAYQEYPKAVKDKYDNEIVVHSPEEEAKITGKSEASLKKAAEEHTAEEQAVLDDKAEAELDELTRRGTDVSEDDIVRMTALAQAKGDDAPKKRGRPSNADKAAAAAKEEGK